MGEIMESHHTFRGKNIKKILKTAIEIGVPENEMLTTTMYRLHLEYKKGNNVKARVPNTKDGYLYSCDAQTLDDVCKQYVYGVFADISTLPPIKKYETVCCFLPVYLANQDDFHKFCQNREIYKAFTNEARKFRRFIEFFGEKFCRQEHRKDWDAFVEKNRPTAINVFDIMESLYFDVPMENLKYQFIIRNQNTETALAELRLIKHFVPRGKEFVEVIEEYAKTVTNKITEIKNQK